VFLAKVGKGRTLAEYNKSQRIFSQGDPAGAIFYIQSGKVKLTVVSKRGKEAVVAILECSDRGGPGGSVIQLQRKAPGADTSADGQLRQGSESGTRDSKDQPGNVG
jgi:CRP-like cAMP-binding protein